MFPRTAFAALLIAANTQPVFAWNNLGHKTVAEIAWRQLDPTTRQNIVDILRRHPRFATDFVGKMDDKALNGDKAVEDHWIFQHAATWPDVIRKNKEFDIPKWHYVDFPLYLDETDQKAIANRLPVDISTDYPTKTPLKEMNVLQAIAHCRAVISGRDGPDMKAIGYCWLLHLVGDIHQPLHSTALFSVNQFPQGDKGGNEILLVHGKNLHALWDGLLGTAYYMRNVDKAVAELSDREKLGDVSDNAADETDPRKWAEESHRMCENFVYCDEIKTAVRAVQPGEKLSPIDLPKSYMQDAGERARRRIVAAGVRLGVMLKSLSQTKPDERQRAPAS